uniref:Transmembrane protein 242 n=1 Tax=Heterorhabditis bacteriophora TaxID=37862 RepID=A0A1I7XEL7_HETBA
MSGVLSPPALPGDSADTLPSAVRSPKTTEIIPMEGKFIDPIDRYSAFIVRGTIVGASLIGVALFFKNSRIFAKFEHVRQIPKDFIQKELELKGKVREVLPSGELRVEHEPIVKLPSLFSLRKFSDKKALLNIRLAGVDLSKAGQQFLTKDLRLNNKQVIFTVIKSSDDSTDAIDADVTVKKNAFSRTNLNVEVVRRGYARVPPPEHLRHLKALQTIPAYSRLVSRLLMCEKVADRRGVGVWERDSWVESIQSYPSQIVQIIKTAPMTKFIVLLFNVTRDVLLYGIKLTQQFYAVALVTCTYIVGGYRQFANLVDRMTDKYNKVRQKLK